MNDEEERPELPCPMCHGIGHFTVTDSGRLVQVECDLCNGEGWLS